MPFKDASKALVAGSPILVFDDSEREGETDIFFSAKHVTPASIRFLREHGGGMVFLASDNMATQKLGLPFAHDIYHAASHDSKEFDILETMLGHTLPYDTRSSFSLFINHKDTFTGITDNDRALTSRSFAELIQNSAHMSDKDSRTRMAQSFRIPGHVPVCIADRKLLQNRQGHTELIVALMKAADITPVALGCEMLANNGNALSSEEARIWAREQGYLFLEGRQIMEACQ
ncbi:MAG: 3,4-dihydroxy-2-butanone-4-phosphate synthase [Candidatus Thermoplasmatota archaeon]|nr:3,4-dihydroxy-2-butanone-4-phosphate synthase [Candidatus Thermoplasmatota archaeon]MEC8997218.1 3,4-dihydroxy-2-butanone-4-phosphate synthase [Candidatus Thermoplasmatota archaeon]MEE3242708.1 3,4-dihydroxy-2-butanone-4-phosphate synthase [Candidatus Thermoplasmatota archaeon]